MILDSLLAKAWYKILVSFFAFVFSISGPAVTPSTEQPIDYTNSKANLVFAAIADPQVNSLKPDRYRYFVEASTDLKSAKGLDAMIIAGDVAEFGLSAEYQLFYDNLGGMDLRYVGIVGNHDIRLRNYKNTVKRFCNFMNTLNGDDSYTALSRSEHINGYKFILLGSDRTEFEESYFTDDTLKWLDDELKEEDGKPVFVLVHQPLKLTNGLPEVWNSPFDSAGSIGDQSDEIKEILNKYDNVIFITGHEHTGFGDYTYEKVGNIHSVNIPSLCCNNDCGENNDHGLDFIVEVYDNAVIFRARNSCEGKWLPEYDLTIPFTSN